MRQVEWGPDCHRIQMAALKFLNLEMSIGEAYDLWGEWSGMHCANWKYLPSSEVELADAIKKALAKEMIYE